MPKFSHGGSGAYAGSPVLRGMTQAEVDASAAAHRVPPEQAEQWAVWDRDCSLWRNRVHDLLMLLLCSPDRYAERIEDLRRKRYGKPSDHAYMAELAEAIASVRADLLSIAPQGSGMAGVWVANEIMGMHGNRWHGSTIMELAAGGWIPRRPARPDAQARPRCVKTEEERMARAADVAASL